MYNLSYETSRPSTEMDITHPLREAYVCHNGSLVWFSNSFDANSQKYQGLGCAWVHKCEYEEEEDDTPLLAPLAFASPKITIAKTTTGSRFVDNFEDEPRQSVASESTAISSTISDFEILKMATHDAPKSRKLKFLERVKKVLGKLLK